MTQFLYVSERHATLIINHVEMMHNLQQNVIKMLLVMPTPPKYIVLHTFFIADIAPIDNPVRAEIFL